MNSRNVYVGIDPGISGAVAIWEGRWSVFDCPVVELKKGKRTRREANPVLMAELIRDIGNDHAIGRVIVYLEAVHAMPGQGVSSMFNFGRNYGQWEGVLAALNCEVHHVTPQRWKKSMLRGMPKGKEVSRHKALSLFPYLADELKRKKDNGRAEALLIGAYGMAASAELARREPGKGE